MVKPKKTLRLVILGAPWVVRYHTPENYLKCVADDSKAEVDDRDRTLDIDLGFLTHELMAHELTHAYAKERSLVELQLNAEQQEDFFCEIVGKHIKTLDRQADTLLKAGRAVKWRKTSL